MTRLFSLGRAAAFGAIFSSAILVATFSVAPVGAQGAGPLLLVLNKDEAAMVMVDPSTRQIVGRAATGEAPHEVTVSSDGRMAFVGNYGAQTPGSTLSVIDIAARKEVRRVDLGPLRRPHGMAFADGKVYFTAEVSRAIARYDPTADKVDWLLGTGQSGTHMILVNAAATRMFTSNIGSNSITLIERGENPLAWNETVIPVGQGPEAIDISPDGKEVWTAHSRDGGVSIIDVASRKVAATLSLGTKRSNRLKFTPDGKLVLISDVDTGDVLVVDVPARTERTRVHVGKNPEGILVEPGGSRAFVAVSGDNNVAILDLKTLELTGRIATGADPDGMAWAAR